MPVNTEHPQYLKFSTKWERCCDVYDGEDAIHDAGAKYLPRLKDQSNEDYNAYKDRTPFYNATYRTIVGLVGMMFRVEPKTDVPDVATEMLKDVTLSGKPLQVFAEAVSTDALKVGRVGILVDCPEIGRDSEQPQKFLTLADQLQQNIRPAMLMYCAQSILNWKTEKVNNQVVLKMVVLKEQRAVAKDEFEDKMEDVYRVLDLENGRYRVRMFKKKDKPGGSQNVPAPAKPINTPLGDEDFEELSSATPLMNGQPLRYIPFVFIGAEDLEPDVTDPPLIDLVNANLAHYRVSADYYHGAHFTGLPTPYISGYVQPNKGEKLYIGSSHAWVFPSEKVKVGYLEFGGEGLGTLEKILDRIETHMAILGARMLEPQKKQAETAESKEIHRKGEESMLSMMSQTISMGIERALKWFTEWAGGDPAGVVYAQNTDFFPAPMDSAMLTAQVSTWQMGGISDRTLFENLKRGEIVPADRTFEEEQRLITEGAGRMSALNALTNPANPAPGAAGDGSGDGSGDTGGSGGPPVA